MSDRAHVLILYNEPVLALDHPDAESEHEILWTADVVSKTLVQAGYRISRLGANDPATLLHGLQSHRPDVVFNLYEGTADNNITETYVAGLLEWLDLPYTGCPYHTLSMGRSKHLTKYLLQGVGLPTPRFFVVGADGVVPANPLDWPVIVKPATQDASVGLDQGSVVTDEVKLEERVQYLLKTYGPPVLVEQFIRGRELNIGLIEAPDLRVLPVSEILFVDPDPNYWPIVTYDAKWKPGTKDYEATPPRYPAEVTPELADKLGALAKAAFRLLGCRDYARVDFRVLPSGEPYILEVNPNPDFCPTAGLSGGLISAGLTHEQFTLDLVKAALARGVKTSRVKEKSSVEPTLRAARPEDSEAVRLLAERSGVFRPDEIAAVTAVFATGGGLDHRCRVAEEGTQIVGYAVFGNAPHTEGAFLLQNLAVQVDRRRSGIGAKLLHAVETDVWDSGGKILLAETTSNPMHTPARQFLQRHGFRLVGDVPDFYKEGDGRMTYAKYARPKRS